MQFTIHPDKRIRMQDDAGVEYADTLENFENDFSGVMPLFGDQSFGARINDNIQAVYIDGNQTSASQELIDFANKAVQDMPNLLAKQVVRHAAEKAARDERPEPVLTPAEKVIRDSPTSRMQLDVIWEFLNDQEVLTGPAKAMYEQIQALKRDHGV